MTDIAQKLLLYHQKMMELAAQSNNEKQEKDDLSKTARKSGMSRKRVSYQAVNFDCVYFVPALNSQPSPKSCHEENAHYYASSTHKADDQVCIVTTTNCTLQKPTIQLFIMFSNLLTDPRRGKEKLCILSPRNKRFRHNW